MDRTCSKAIYGCQAEASIAIGLKVFQINDRRNNVPEEFYCSQHIPQELPLAVGSGRNNLGHWAAMAGNPQGLACFVNLLDQPKALRLEFRNGNIGHDHYFIYSQ